MKQESGTSQCAWGWLIAPSDIRETRCLFMSWSKENILGPRYSPECLHWTLPRSAEGKCGIFSSGSLQPWCSTWAALGDAHPRDEKADTDTSSSEKQQLGVKDNLCWKQSLEQPEGPSKLFTNFLWRAIRELLFKVCSTRRQWRPQREEAEPLALIEALQKRAGGRQAERAGKQEKLRHCSGLGGFLSEYFWGED